MKLAQQLTRLSRVSVARALPSRMASSATSAAAPPQAVSAFTGATPFHLAFPVHDLDAARAFYGGLLGCDEGRSSKTWIDFNLGGGQIVCHFASAAYRGTDFFNGVDKDMVPVPHFGLCLSEADFHALAARVKAAGVPFIVEPHVRFPGAPGEQWTMCVPALRARVLADCGPASPALRAGFSRIRAATTSSSRR
jgi:extradiol dioxygenase family protein